MADPHVKVALQEAALRTALVTSAFTISTLARFRASGCVSDCQRGGFVCQRFVWRVTLQQRLDRAGVRGMGATVRVRPWRCGTGRPPSSRGMRRRR